MANGISLVPSGGVVPQFVNPEVIPISSQISDRFRATPFGYEDISAYQELIGQYYPEFESIVTPEGPMFFCAPA